MFELSDIGDAARVRSVLEKYRPSALMHFAAYAYVSESVANSLLYYRNIIGEAASLLQALIGFTPTPVVFSSSCATYGVADRLPISEDHPQRRSVLTATPRLLWSGCLVISMRLTIFVRSRSGASMRRAPTPKPKSAKLTNGNPFDPISPGRPP